MYLENVKVDFVACYQIAGKKKNDPPKKHETSFGTFVLETGLTPDELGNIIDAVLKTFDGDYVEARVSLITSNI
tara:strand:+ start:1643 stop:1864 length:222 start_codon:yes stop_codon:yes gene_type:complete